MSNDQEQALRILDNALWRIGRRGDCEYYDDGNNQPKPCDCPRCVAIAVLEAAKNWRFHGAHHERIEKDHWPREKKMHAAWMKLANGNQGGPDHLLAKAILNDDSVPSARDWYVATSVIQWLATNVGMTVLEGAGFKYQQWEQDAANGELFQRRLERENNDTKRRDQKGLDRLQLSQLEAIDYAGHNPADGPPIGGARLGASASAPYTCNVPMCGESGVCEECRRRGAK